MDWSSPLLRPQERVLSTLETDGSRRWMYPRLAKGRFWRRRQIVAYALIAIFTLIPYIRINGKPAVLLDVVHRQFTLFGITFLPTDTRLLALLMVSALLSIFFITAMLGRVWCGWACPQTVYMEFVYRPLERLFTGRTGLGGKPSDTVPAWRKGLLYLAYLLVSMFLAHTFLAYFVGVDALRTWMTRSPAEHPVAFIVVMATVGLMLFDFVYFREQTCIIACPYGRLQSVLLDPNSLIIGYDTQRGEPRGKKKVASSPLPVARDETLATGNSQLATQGDCIACDLCVHVCPTGIDIRNGLQIECIGCAQCIDACDTVMTKLKRPLGLIRYSSQNAMAHQPQRLLRPRVIIYCTVVTVFVSLLAYLLATRSLADVLVQRNVGRPFAVTDGLIENDLRVKITNRDNRERIFTLSVPGRPDIRLIPMRDTIRLKPGESTTEPVRILVPPALFSAGRMDATVRVSSDDVNVDRSCRLLGPL